jgi:uroporphyrinogen decarboxylase
MTSRERVLCTAGHQEPDRIPFNLRPGPEITSRFEVEFGSADFAEHFRHDIRYVSYPLAEKPANGAACDWTPMPGSRNVQDVHDAALALHRCGLAVCSGYICGVFEQAKHWLGDETALAAPYEDPARLARTLDRITEWKSALYGAYAAAGVDIVWIGDDLGTQRSLVMSPAQYRQWYRPCHERIVNHLRALRADVKVAFHCCGHVTPLIPDLIELGIDILEAVQAEAMDIAHLKREFGKDITFWGGIGAQSVLQGTPAEVVQGVANTLRIMAPGGGYIAAPCHALTSEVPWENVLAFHRAMDTCGAYGGS